METQRLIIRENRWSDLKNHHRLMSDAQVMYYIQDIQTHSLEESRDNLAFSIEEAKNKNRQCYFFAMTLKDDTYIGQIGFTILEQNKSGGVAELGYFILKEHWHHGYVTEACKAVIDFAFEKIGLHKITTGCIYDNYRSEGIMKKLGMVKEGHLKAHVLLDDKWVDRVNYGCFKRDR